MTTDTTYEKDKALGLYIHIPFCLSKCSYCDFYSLPCKSTDEDTRNAYVNALTEKLRLISAQNERPCISSVFIGGGTPTFLKTEQLIRITDAVNKLFHLTRNLEFTVEANPGTLDEEKLTALRDAKVNRISLGFQSANEKELKALGRIHSFEQAKEAFELTRKCGFDNISIDLMYGIPYQTEQSFLTTVEQTARLSPEHISMYGLQLEEGTPMFADRNKLPFPTEEQTVKMHRSAIDMLKECGYSRYEISNFSKKGKECAHNLGYWHARQYLGVGAGAYSYFNGTRFHTESDVLSYIKSPEPFGKITVDEVIDGEETVTEYLLLSLRLTEGFSVKELFDRTRNANFYINRCKKYIEIGFMKNECGRIFFTDDGFDVSNTILSELLY